MKGDPSKRPAGWALALISAALAALPLGLAFLPGVVGFASTSQRALKLLLLAWAASTQLWFFHLAWAYGAERRYTHYLAMVGLALLYLAICGASFFFFVVKTFESRLWGLYFP